MQLPGGNQKLQVGDVFEVHRGMKVYSLLPSVYVYVNGKKNESGTAEVVAGVDRSRPSGRGAKYKTDYLLGEYLVVEAWMDGGWDNHREYCPNGWHVRALKMKDGAYDPNGVMVSFYQSGSFTVVNPEVHVLRKMKRIVTFEPLEE